MEGSEGQANRASADDGDFDFSSSHDGNGSGCEDVDVDNENLRKVRALRWMSRIHILQRWGTDIHSANEAVFQLTCLPVSHRSPNGPLD